MAKKQTFEFFFNQLVKGYRSMMGKDPEGLDLIKIKQEAGQKAKDANKVIQFPQKRDFAAEIKAMVDDGTLKMGEVTKKNDNVLRREMFKNSNLNKPTIEGQMEKINAASKRLEKIMQEREAMFKPKTDAEIKAKFDKQNKESIERLKKKKEDDPEFYTGGMVDVEPNLSDIGHGSDSLMARTRLISPNNQATTSTGLNYLLAEDNDNIRVPFNNAGFVFNPYRNRRLKESDHGFLDFFDLIGDDLSEEEFKQILQDLGVDKKAEGGRIGFSKGKIAKEILDKGRRGFMKAAGATGAGIAALKTGLLGFGKDAAPVVEKAVEAAKGVPPYFYQLIDVIKSKGREIRSYGDQVKQYLAPSKDGKSELMLTEDLATGDIQVKKIHKEGDDMVTKTEEMNFNAGRADETTKLKPPDDYEEVTSFHSRIYKDEFNDPDFVDGIDVESIVKEIDVKKIKKADGGRIGFSKGKLATDAIIAGRKFLERVFGKEKFANMIENDPEMHQGMLEVVEMFRNKDKAGLIEYMQTFLPKMSKKELENFIVGSGDTAGIEGQLIRLGSGRDYKGKIEMIEEANNMRKLEDFEIEGVSKNAEGGRIPYFKGGITALKGILNYFGERAGKKGSDQLKDINPKALPQGIENIMGPEHMKMLQENQTGYLESLLKIIKSDKQFLDNVKNRVKEMAKDAPKGFEDVAEKIGKQMVKSSMKDDRFKRMKVYDKINIDDAIVDVEQMIKNRRVKESDGRALNASGGLQTMLGE